ncbi:XRE family transcriptional regulator [Bacillus canaveralius]|uniref:XRE family transcriptional regulator n=1 Tax=Bacillus canaveralius TaxID=1403243 RepID=A0A2N5GM07_9BACI|nr:MULTISPECIES: helix-turn-helix transcriptional regulator [Bacillus]PLR82902.1 XRE family transcriptional regulator [Bacillus canaveralius]PLR85272.1 XRE family transcriptional regulator [Bacillus sp. V33-4]PLR97093.1 XRE family transcriptional regulator [Bacillus canaveralius]
MIHINVERIRQARGVTKTHMAKKLNLSLQGYRHIASGSVRLDAERLKVIGLILNVNPSTFFDDKLTELVIKEIDSIGSNDSVGQPNKNKKRKPGEG